MHPSSKIDQALLFTASRFEGISDEDGQPYMLHCLRVMLSFTDPTLQIVGLMHDLIEDTPTTLDELIQLGFGTEIVEAIGLLTRTREISYADYIIRLKTNEIARQVKLADLRDNSDIRRSLYRASRPKEDLKQAGRYMVSYQYLEGRLSLEDYLHLMVDLEP